MKTTTIKRVEKLLAAATELQGKKVLYFAEVGGDFEQTQENGSDVLCHRILTSFTNLDGKQFYLDIGNTYKRNKKGKPTEEMMIHIDFCFEVPANTSDEIQYNKVFDRSKEHLIMREINYTKENIIKWINERLNCDFDTLHVLDSMYQYYPQSGDYNKMENIVLNHETIAKQVAAFEEYKTWYTQYRKFPCLEVIERTDSYIKIRTSDSETMISKNNIERVKTIYI